MKKIKKPKNNKKMKGGDIEYNKDLIENFVKEIIYLMMNDDDYSGLRMILKIMNIVLEANPRLYAFLSQELFEWVKINEVINNKIIETINGNFLLYTGVNHINNNGEIFEKYFDNLNNELNNDQLFETIEKMIRSGLTPKVVSCQNGGYWPWSKKRSINIDNQTDVSYCISLFTEITIKILNILDKKLNNFLQLILSKQNVIAVLSNNREQICEFAYANVKDSIDRNLLGDMQDFIKENTISIIDLFNWIESNINLLKNLICKVLQNKMNRTNIIWSVFINIIQYVKIAPTALSLKAAIENKFPQFFNN